MYGDCAMNMLVWLFLAGLVPGSIAGYFFAWPILLILSVLTIVCANMVLKDASKVRGPSLIGVIFIGSPLVIGLHLGLWGMWVVTSVSSVFPSLTTFWAAIRPYVLR